MPEPILGETRDEPCSWGCGRTITVTFRRYPAATGIEGTFWDAGDHSCGVLRLEKFARFSDLTGYDLGRAKRTISILELTLSPPRIIDP